MARISSRYTGESPQQVTNLCRGSKTQTVTVGTSVTQLPATNLSGRRSLLIQNKHASNILYVGTGIPYIFFTHHPGGVFLDAAHDKREANGLVWSKSGGGTNEWFVSLAGNADPGLTEITYLYYATSGGAETLATNGALCE